VNLTTLGRTTDPARLARSLLPRELRVRDVYMLLNEAAIAILKLELLRSSSDAPLSLMASIAINNDIK
jgi:hypothetical protein